MLGTEQQLLHPLAASLSNVLLKAVVQLRPSDVIGEAQENPNILNTLGSRRKYSSEEKKRMERLHFKNGGLSPSS